MPPCGFFKWMAIQSVYTKRVNYDKKCNYQTIKNSPCLAVIDYNHW